MNPFPKITAHSLLDKIHSTGKSVVRDIKNEPTMAKIGLGMGATSLALSMNNARANSERNFQEQQKLEMEQRSIQALNKIHKALVKPETPPV